MSTSYSPLDLHSIAVLINYERTSGPMGDYRFRHTKLCDIADSSNTFPSLPRYTIDWFEAGTDDRPKRGFLLRAETPITKDAPDMPDDIRSSQCSRSVEDLTKEESSTIFWEVRGHNGCYDAISILQNLFLMFPSGQTMRVRAPDGTDFITEVSNRWILEYKLHKPKQATMTLIVGDPKQSQSLWTGEGDEMIHSVWEFFKPGESQTAIVLDLSSMQFGAAGRGRSGDFFMLDSTRKWKEFVGKIAHDFDFIKNSYGINPAPDLERSTWHMAVAQRVQERWEARNSNHWCALCGKPNAEKRCSRCSQEYYCSDAHFAASWKGWHKRWCVPRASN